jgi:hypothetical protein
MYSSSKAPLHCVARIESADTEGYPPERKTKPRYIQLHLFGSCARLHRSRMLLHGGGASEYHLLVFKKE